MKTKNCQIKFVRHRHPPPPRTPKCAFSQSPVHYPLFHHHLHHHHHHKHHQYHQHHPERACGGLGLASLAPSTSSIREAWEEAAGRNRDTSLVLRPLCIHQHQLSLQVMCLTPPLPNNPASTLHQSDKTKNKGIKNVTCQCLVNQVRLLLGDGFHKWLQTHIAAY